MGSPKKLTGFFSRSIAPDVNDAVARFVSNQIWAQTDGFEKYCTYGVFDNELNIIGGMVYHNYDPDAETVELSGASLSKRWLSPSRVLEIINFPFERLDCQVAIARDCSTRADLRKLWGSFGATEYIIPHIGGVNNPPIALHVLTQNDWRKSGFYRRAMRATNGVEYGKEGTKSP